ncbi:hypothetical protein DB032_15710 [Chromobacterium sp. Panama]|uniref:hypothetical protein n=1 Tax=Chromobacterium sp. Panama TaxID=2161826 RepID=UPI000D2F6581|nr:hypothetical protein [Chromobacterium sp. Panama]PTU66270.1 hypothetical protein DB032_15710 [Chromobacterium sp. Panama]
MMNLLIRQHQSLKKAVQLIQAYEAHHGLLSKTCPAYRNILTEVKFELNLTMDLYYRCMRQYRPSMRLGFLKELPPLMPTKPRNEAAWATIRQLWSTGKWSNRDRCVRACYKQAGFTNMVEARLALVRQPPPPILFPSR